MMSPIGFRVRELREARGWTQTERAKRAGIRRATVNRLENQRVTSIDLTVLEKLAKALDVDPAYLLVKEGRTRKKNR
jgi:transcriptional regulator with XRE-family HTH domain